MSWQQNRQNLTINLIKSRQDLNEEAGDRQADYYLGYSLDAPADAGACSHTRGSVIGRANSTRASR